MSALSNSTCESKAQNYDDTAVKEVVKEVVKEYSGTIANMNVDLGAKDDEILKLQEMLRALTKGNSTEDMLPPSTSKVGNTDNNAEREDGDISFSSDIIDLLAFTPVFETDIPIPPDIPLPPDNETNSLTSGSQSNKRTRRETLKIDENCQRPRTESASSVNKSSSSEEAMTL